MCKFFSFCADIDGEIYYLSGFARKRAELRGENPDSHSFITEYYQDKIKPKMKDTEIFTGSSISSVDDAVWKFELPMDKDNRPEITLEFIEKNMVHDGGLPKSILTVETLKKIKDQLLKINWDDVFEPKIEIPQSIKERVAAGYGGFFINREQVDAIVMQIIMAIYDECPERIIDLCRIAGGTRHVWNEGRKEVQVFVDPLFTDKCFLSFTIRNKYVPVKGVGYLNRLRTSIVIKDVFELES